MDRQIRGRFREPAWGLHRSRIRRLDSRGHRSGPMEFDGMTSLWLYLQFSSKFQSTALDRNQPRPIPFASTPMPAHFLS